MPCKPTCQGLLRSKVDLEDAFTAFAIREWSAHPSTAHNRLLSHAGMCMNRERGVGRDVMEPVIVVRSLQRKHGKSTVVDPTLWVVSGIACAVVYITVYLYLFCNA